MYLSLMISRLLERFLDAVRAARAADGVELEQGQLRLAINCLLVAYFCAAFLWDGVLEPRETRMIFLGFTLVIPIAFLMYGWMLWRPGVNHARRRSGIVLDMALLVLFMTLGEEAGALMLFLLLWVVIGNGFRFGRWYLHFAQGLALAGFTLVLLLGQFWRQHATIAAALYLALVAIPVYVGLLLSRLHSANERMQQAHRAAEVANAAKTRFLAAASHDLRQPMQALSVYTSVLDERVRDAASHRLVQGIQLGVKTLEQLFDSLLDVAQIESGKIRPKVGEFALAPLIENVVAAERPLAAQKGLELRAARTDAVVRSDPALLERMLKNLLINAIRYTETGGIVVGCRRAGAGRLRLEVVDSGIGIPRKEHARIFDEYYQVAGGSGQGLGLGLPIVKSLGDLLGHRIGVRSASNRGSAFSIELERATRVTPVAALAAPVLPALGGARVVLVDDDAEIRDSVRLLLESWGCRAISGANAAEVENKLRAARVRPDALIVDYRLADASTGLQVVERLRAEYGATLPALMITGSPNAAVLQREFAGIPVALKPVAPGKLRAFLSEAMRRSALTPPAPRS